MGHPNLPPNPRHNRRRRGAGSVHLVPDRRIRGGLGHARHIMGQYGPQVINPGGWWRAVAGHSNAPAVDQRNLDVIIFMSCVLRSVLAMPDRSSLVDDHSHGRCHGAAPSAAGRGEHSRPNGSFAPIPGASRGTDMPMPFLDHRESHGRIISINICRLHHLSRYGRGHNVQRQSQGFYNAYGVQR